MAETTKAITVRLSDDLAYALTTVAMVDGQPEAEIIRQAIAAHVGCRRSSADFRDKLKASIERATTFLGDWQNVVEDSSEESRP